MKRKIVIVGSSNTDMVIQLKNIPKPGETLLGGEFTMAPGGKGANQAVGAARAADKDTGVVFVARVGSDLFGENAVKGFQKDGIDTTYVFSDKGKPSGVALIFVAKNGENSIGVASGANANLTPKDIQKAKKAIHGADIVVAQLETPMDTIETLAEMAFAEGVPMILNPAPVQKLSRKLLKEVTILTPNETETEALTGIAVTDEASAKKAAEALHKKGVPIVIITMGSKGCYVSAPAGSEFIPAHKVKAVDTTAAGDVFNGALAVALAEEQNLLDAARFAGAAAALSVTKLGAQPSAPTREEINKLLK